MKVELVRVEEREFSRGERAIVVDGVRWGRTIVTHKGMHGTKYTFKQENGGVILRDPMDRHPTEFVVNSEKKRYSNKGTWRPTEGRVHEMAVQLVESGLLRHPDIVQAEHEAVCERFRQHCAEKEIEKKARFQTKAREALGINDPGPSEVVDRVVEAMEWAQSQ